MSEYVQVQLIGPMSSLERHDRFEAPLHDALRTAGLGEVAGGDENVAESTHFLTGVKSSWDGIDVRLNDLERGLPFLAKELKRLGADKYTRIIYTHRGNMAGYPL